jgi:hypothetical protein
LALYRPFSGTWTFFDATTLELRGLRNTSINGRGAVELEHEPAVIVEVAK